MSNINQDKLKVAKTIKLFIGGDFPRTESGRSFPIYIHKTKKVYAHLCLASRKDLRNSITAAQAALPGWAAKTAYNRSQVLYRMAEMMEARREEFYEVLKQTLGYEKMKSEKSLTAAIDALVYYAGWADKYQQVVGAVNPVSGPHHNFTSSEPTGIVGLIADDNFDLSDFVAQIAAIITSGNTLVALMGEKGAAVLAPLAEVLATSDLSKGVVNLLSGSVDELYKQFASHMEIQAICCQSSRILAEVKSLGAENMKRVVQLKKNQLNLDSVISFTEFKTVWHPIGN